MNAGFFSRFFGDRKLDFEAIRAEIRRIERELRENFDADAFRNGDWFLQNFTKFVERYRNYDRVRQLEAAHPEMSEDQLAQILTSDAIRLSTLTGGATGVAVTAAELSGLMTWGLSLTVGAASAIAEMIYVTNLQMQLVFDLATVNGITPSFEDSGEMLVIFTAALGFENLDVSHADESAQVTVMTKAVLQRQLMKRASWLGLRLVRNLVSRYAVPVLNIGLAAWHDRYLTTKVARVARERFGKIRVMKERLFELRPKIADNQKDVLLSVMAYLQSDALLTIEEIYILRELARSIQASELWQQILAGDLELEPAEFIKKFRDPAHFDQREILLNVLQIVSETKMLPNEREAEFLRKLVFG